MRTFQRKFKIRFDQVDAAGLVYYPHFLHLCHATLEDFIDSETEIGYRGLIIDRGWGLPTVAVQGDFAAPLRFGDTAVVTQRIERLGRTSIVFGYDIHRGADDVLSARTLVTCVLLDIAAHKPVPFPDDLRAVFAA